MGKTYMRPEGKVVALCMNENISVSRGENIFFNDAFGLSYRMQGETAYIYNSTTVKATEVGDDRYKAFYDLLLTYVYDLSNCRFDPTPHD